MTRPPLPEWAPHEMLAPNVLTIPIDTAIVDEFAELAGTAESDADYCIFRPPWVAKTRHAVPPMSMVLNPSAARPANWSIGLAGALEERSANLPS